MPFRLRVVVCFNHWLRVKIGTGEEFALVNEHHNNYVTKFVFNRTLTNNNNRLCFVQVQSSNYSEGD